MDFLLPVLLALPLAVGAVILIVSAVRRRRHAQGTTEAVHRGQTDTAALQSAAVYPPAQEPRVRGGRERRGSAPTNEDG
jgi:hypothetical protein